jgi:FKBP-type peptidyl-prolyl cis-trans isomerase FklB
VGIGRRMQQAKLEGVDIDVLARAIRDVFGGGKLALTDTEIDTVINAYVTEQFRKPGEDFLAANKANPGVQVTKSGLQYKVLKQGDGPTPKASDQVKTHYKGTLIDGKEFDSSIARGEPAVFPVGGVIAGWTEALQLMKVGDKWELYIPSDLAYGERGSPPKIPPHSALIFEIELLGIEK